MRVNTLLAAVFAGWAALGCMQADSNPTRRTTIPGGLQQQPTDREYAVYAALLKTLYVDITQTALTGDGNRIGGIGPVVTQIVLADQTLDIRVIPTGEGDEVDKGICGAELISIAQTLKGCNHNLAEAFAEANRHPASLQQQHISVESLKIILIQQRSYAWPMQPEYTKPYVYSRYPRCQGVSLLSRVGFSQDGNRAVVYLQTCRAMLYGRGWVFLLERSGETWNVREGELKWMS